jgi:hypothetical protein
MTLRYKPVLAGYQYTLTNPYITPMYLIAILLLVPTAISPFVRAGCDTVFEGYDIHG